MNRMSMSLADTCFIRCKQTNAVLSAVFQISSKIEWWSPNRTQKMWVDKSFVPFKFEIAHIAMSFWESKLISNKNFHFLCSPFAKVPEEKLSAVACPYCMKEFTANTNKNRHIRNKHRFQRRRFQCLLCFKLLATADSLKSHSKSMHGGHMMKKEILTPMESQNEPSQKLIALQIEFVN